MITFREIQITIMSSKNVTFTQCRQISYGNYPIERDHKFPMGISLRGNFHIPYKDYLPTGNYSIVYRVYPRNDHNILDALFCYFKG